MIKFRQIQFFSNSTPDTLKDSVVRLIARSTNPVKTGQAGAGLMKKTRKLLKKMQEDISR